MQDYALYTVNQFGALILSVILGAGVYIVVVVQDKKIELSWRFVIFTLIISAFITHLAAQIVIYLEKERLFSIVTLSAAFFAQWIVEQLKQKFPKLFDTALRKVGFDINNNDEDEGNINQQNSDPGGDYPTGNFDGDNDESGTKAGD